MNSTDSKSSSAFDSEWLKICLLVLLFLGFLEIIVGRVLIHVGELSTVLLPFASVVMNFEAIIEVPILMLFAYIFWKNKNSHVATVLFGLSSLLLVATVLLYVFSLAGGGFPEVLWLSFLFMAFVTIFVASTRRILAEAKTGGTSALFLVAFLVSASVTYFCVYVYFMSFNLMTFFGIVVPEPVTLFSLAQSLVIVDALLFFLYALLASYGNLRFDRRLLVNVFLLPSVIVGFLLVGLVGMPTASRFDMAEIMSLVLVMWGFAVPKSQVFLYIVTFWFFLVAALFLREKARKSNRSIYMQEFTAAFLIFFAGFINTPLYLLMGVIAVILFSSRQSD